MKFGPFLSTVGSLATAVLLSASCGKSGDSKDSSADADGSCTEQSDCAQGEVCVLGSCEQPCSDDSDCPESEPICALALCVECADESHCDTSEYCEAGSCQDDICVPGEFSCDPDAKLVLECDANGGEYKDQPCDSETSCAISSEGVECLPWVCDPGTNTCDDAGNVLTSCSPDGLMESVTDCSAVGGRCVLGECREIVCEPDSYFCQDGASYLCAPEGTSFSVDRTCPENQFCNPDFGRCEDDVCTPGEGGCSGDLATVCAADGSGPADDPINCEATGEVCYHGECAEEICEDGSTYCDPELLNVMICESNGTREYSNSRCFDDTYCAVTEEYGPQCVPDICEPGAKACDGETVATCIPSGGDYVSHGTDCSTNGKLCVVGDGCQDSEVITIGDPALAERTGANPNTVALSLLAVDLDRTLTKIEIFADAPTSVDVHWLVYEADALDSTSYTLIHQSTSAIQGTDTFVGSSDISVPLKAGKFYFVGFRSDGYFGYFRDPEYGDLPYRLGQWIGSIHSTDEDPIETTRTANYTPRYRAYQRWTTTP